MGNNTGFDLPKGFELFGYDMQFSFINGELYELAWYFKTIETMIENAEKRDVAKVRSRSKGEIDWSEDYPYWWQTIFATQLRFSFVMWAVAVLEHNLKDVCRWCSSAFGKEWEEPRQEVVKKSKKLLTDIGLIKKNQIKLWERLERQVFIRNHLAHQGIFVISYSKTDKSIDAKKTRTLAQFVKKDGGIEIKNGGLVIESEFCNSIITTMRELFSGIHDEIEKKAFEN